MLDGVPVVLKWMDRACNPVVDCKKEAAVYRDVSGSKYIPRLLNESHGPDCSILVFEAVSHKPQNLHKRVMACAAAVGKGSKHMPLLEILSVVRRVMGGIWSLNHKRWCHGDIKPPNIAMGDDGAYVVDLGVAEKVGTHLRGSMIGTRDYSHPEIELGYVGCMDVVLQFGHDFFSLGLVLAFMLVRGDEFRVQQLRLVAGGGSRLLGVVAGSRVRLGMDYSHALGGVVELLGQEIKAVVQAHEEQLQKEGLLQQGTAVEVRQGLVDLVAQLLLEDVRQTRDVVAIMRMLDRLESKAAGIKQQQQ